MEVKLCKDCSNVKIEWIELGIDGPSLPRPVCKACVKNTVQSLISGRVDTGYYDCSDARSMRSLCGADGKLFEQKKPWWRFWA